jgi:hypothetical protein
MTSQSTLASFQLLQRLRSFVDTRLAAPPQSEHAAPVGPVLIGVRRGVRRALQPLINEVLERQTSFNELTLEWGRAITRDVESLERSLVAMRASIDLRLSRLEAIAARLERLQADETNSPQPPTRGTNGHDQV